MSSGVSADGRATESSFWPIFSWSLKNASSLHITATLQGILA
jgi:hypothetical protein